MRVAKATALEGRAPATARSEVELPCLVPIDEKDESLFGAAQCTMIKKVQPGWRRVNVSF